MGLGAWIFNVIFVVAILTLTYGEANKETMPADNVESARFSLLIIFIIVPILVALVF